MRLGWYAARVVAGACLILTGCGGSAPPALQPSRPATAARSPGDVASRPEAAVPRQTMNEFCGATISGRVTTADRVPLLTGAVVIMPVDPGAPPLDGVDDVQILSDGSFTIRQVPPGMYQIRAQAAIRPNDVSLFATYKVTVDAEDVTGIQMTLVRGATASGTVEVEDAGTGSPALERLRVRFPLADGTMFGDALTGDVARNGAFRVRGLMPGLHYVRVDGLGHPWLVDRVLWRGRDVTDVPFEFESGVAYDGIRVAVREEAAEIRGVARDQSGRPSASALVLVIPLSQHVRVRGSRRLVATRANEAGEYAAQGLAPGDYRVAATTELREHEVYAPEVLSALSTRGTPVRLEKRQTRSVDAPVASVQRSAR